MVYVSAFVIGLLLACLEYVMSREERIRTKVDRIEQWIFRE